MDVHECIRTRRSMRKYTDQPVSAERGTLHLGLLDHERAGRVLELPEGVKLFELIPLGTPAKEGTAPPRRAITEFAHKNRFGAAFCIE